eukprot:4209839-Ditylum_brightwellii.AAC.1
MNVKAQYLSNAHFIAVEVLSETWVCRCLCSRTFEKCEFALDPHIIHATALSIYSFGVHRQSQVSVSKSILKKTGLLLCTLSTDAKKQKGNIVIYPRKKSQR